MRRDVIWAFVWNQHFIDEVHGIELPKHTPHPPHPLLDNQIPTLTGRKPLGWFHFGVPFRACVYVCVRVF